MNKIRLLNHNVAAAKGAFGHTAERAYIINVTSIHKATVVCKSVHTSYLASCRFAGKGYPGSGGESGSQRSILT
jgi:hypothetical protein